MSKKKIAICITGIDRTFNHCINSLKENLINCNDYEFHIIGLITSEDNSIDKSNFNFLKFDKNQPLPNLSYQSKKYTTPGVVYQNNVHIQCYYQLKGLYEVNKLRIQYEIENNIVFDYLVRYRTDFNLLSKIDLSKLQDNIVYVPTCHDHTGYNDRFAVGDRNVMNTYLNRYEFWIMENDHIHNYNTHAENNLKIYLDENKITVKRLDFDYAFRRSAKYHPWLKIKEIYGIDELNTDCVVNGEHVSDGYMDLINKKITPPLPLHQVELYYKEWANRALCKWNISPEDGLSHIIHAIQNNIPLSYTRFGDGELILLKEYFRLIKNDSYYIDLCNANHHIPTVKEWYYLSNNIQQYANMAHNKTVTHYTQDRWNIHDEVTKRNIIDIIGSNIIYALQNSSYLGIFEYTNDYIGDYYLHIHTYTPPVELFAACKVDFSKLTSVLINTNESLSNPYKFKEILNGKPIHIFTSNEEELKYITKLHEILEVDITYTNITPIKGKWETHSFAYNEYLQEVSKSIKEQIILFGLGVGAKHLPSYLEKNYGKTAIDMGSVLDAWSGKISRPWMKDIKHTLPVSYDKIVELYPWDHNKPTY